MGMIVLGIVDLMDIGFVAGGEFVIRLGLM